MTAATLIDYQTADAKWFKKNPGRRFRLRSRYIGETLAPRGEFVPDPPPPFRRYVLIEQLAPGIRVRRFITGLPQASGLPKDDDSIRGIAEALGFVEAEGAAS